MNTLVTTLPAAAAEPLMPLRRLLRAYLNESRFQFIQALRAPAFAFPFLVLPVPLYLFFGVVMIGGSKEIAANPVLMNYSFSAWCSMAVMGPAIFGIGVRPCDGARCQPAQAQAGTAAAIWLIPDCKDPDVAGLRGHIRRDS